MCLVLFAIAFYLLCWIHFIYRVVTGGKYDVFGPGAYGTDERCAKADFVSGMTVLCGTIVLVILIINMV